MERKIGCVIMASGMARRFGSNKLLHDFHGEPMIRRILDSTGQLPFAARVVVTRHSQIADICQVKQIPVILHDLPLRSDTVRLGLTALLRQLPDMDGCMFTASDQPCLKMESIAAMCAAFDAAPDHIYRLSFAGTPGNPVIFPRSTFEELLHLPEGKGGGVIMKRHPELVLGVEATDEMELTDVDTPEILEQLL